MNTKDMILDEFEQKYFPKEKYHFRCRVCGFVRAEYVSPEDAQKGVKCWLNNCGGIMDKLLKPF